MIAFDVVERGEEKEAIFCVERLTGRIRNIGGYFVDAVDPSRLFVLLLRGNMLMGALQRREGFFRDLNDGLQKIRFSGTGDGGVRPDEAEVINQILFAHACFGQKALRASFAFLERDQYASHAALEDRLSLQVDPAFRDVPRHSRFQFEGGLNPEPTAFFKGNDRLGYIHDRLRLRIIDRIGIIGAGLHSPENRIKVDSARGIQWR